MKSMIESLRRSPSGNAAAALVSAALALGSVMPAAAQDFYAGKQLTLIVGTDAGTGYDVYGRIVARHLVRLMPGKPTLIVQNMTGAGSIRAAEHMFNIAAKDGTVIAIVFPGAVFEPLAGDKTKYRFDPTKFEYLGTADSGTRLCATALTSKVKTFKQAQQEVAIIGASAPGGSTWDYPTMLNVLAGTKFKVVSGYKATVDIAVAVDRGEVDGWCGVDVSTHTAVRPTWLPNKEVNFLVQLGLEPNPEMTGLGIPSIMEFVAGEDRKVMELIVSQQVFQRPFLAPPGTPPAQLQTLRDAFDATMRDTEFLTEAAKAKLTVNPRNGAQVAELVNRLYDTPKELVARMTKAIRP